MSTERDRPDWLTEGFDYDGPLPGMPPFVSPAWFATKTSLSPTVIRKMTETVARRRIGRPDFLAWWPTDRRLTRNDGPWLLARASLSAEDSQFVARLARDAFGIRHHVDESGLFTKFYERFRRLEGIVVRGRGVDFREMSFARMFELGSEASSIMLASTIADDIATDPELEAFIEWSVSRFPETVQKADELITAGKTGLIMRPPPVLVETSLTTKTVRTGDPDPDRVARIEAELADRLAEIEALREDLDDLNLRHADLQRTVAAVRAGHDPNRQVDDGRLPKTHHDLVHWIETRLAPTVHVLPRAFRSLRKAPDVDVERLAAGLAFLRNVYVPYRSGASELDSETYRSRLVDAGFGEGPSFTTPSSIEAFPEYKATWNGRVIDLDRHLKRGIGNATRTMIRIYFHFDEETRTAVVGHMPGHLANWRKS